MLLDPSTALVSISSVCSQSQHSAPVSLLEGCKAHFTHTELKVPGNLCVPLRGLPTQDSSLTSDLDNWRGTVCRAPLWDWAEVTPLQPWGLCLTSHLCPPPLPFVLVLFLYFPVIFVLIHTNIYLRGTWDITRCVLPSVMSCSCCWPGNHNDTVVFACACMSVAVFPVPWTDCYSFNFQWVKRLRTEEETGILDVV